MNCKKDTTTILGEFCSDTCSEQWQDKNQKCKSCGKDMNLLEEEYTIKQNGVLCKNCGHGDYSG
ncbi:MAG: hypothetical protein GTN97_07115 [Nitrosopumilaceae archaeon]|nr:hypothetical protein [Nitrosopumilaceae archaeon]